MVGCFATPAILDAPLVFIFIDILKPFSGQCTGNIDRREMTEQTEKSIDYNFSVCSVISLLSR
jgi:hypothetical protein